MPDMMIPFSAIDHFSVILRIEKMKEIKLTEDTKLKSKIHKNKLNVRPIINNIDHLTSLLSLFIDLVF
jgi:hypothetical protein